ncbi:MAG: CrcB family protein, partial [Rhodococcus sp. (in: high G+C Gram-positive bacteria)]|uniref:CrcB family protein n=1 Tax=Rhodococcus sp. TaxID=1831 RepID=UPI003BAF1D53
MNIPTSTSYLSWAAAGGALGALLHYLMVTGFGPVVGTRRVTVVLAMCSCMLLGVFAAAGRDGNASVFVGVGLLGSLTPFTAFVDESLRFHAVRSFKRVLILAVWT